MTTKLIPTPELAKQAWDEMDHQSFRGLEEKLNAAGYASPSFKTLSSWAKDGNWTRKPKVKPIPEVKAKKELDNIAAALTGDPRAKAEHVVDAVMKALPPPGDKPKEEPKAEQAKPEGEPESDADRDKRLNDQFRDRMESIANADLAATQQLASLGIYRASAIMSELLIAIMPQRLALDPESVGNAHLANAKALEFADLPLKSIVKGREAAMKTVDGHEILEPSREDPLAAEIASFGKVPNAA